MFRLESSIYSNCISISRAYTIYGEVIHKIIKNLFKKYFDESVGFPAH